VLADAFYHTLLVYNKEGRCLGPISNEVERSYAGFFPSHIAVRGSEFLLELSSHRVVTLDASFVPKLQTDVRAATLNGPQQVDSMFMSQATESDLLTFSDFQGPLGWRSAFLRTALKNAAEVRVLGSDMTKEDPSRAFYQLGNQYIAALGETGYILRMDPEMSIVRNDSGSDALVPLEAFPPGSRQLAPLPHIHSFKDANAIFGKVEQMTMPVGLFGWKDYLYVVSHNPRDAAASWRITKIDPLQDKVIGYSSIPAIAAHLTIIPGPINWSFVERAHVKAFGDAPASTMLNVPSGLIEGISSPDERMCGDS
jgi:hypothetical protein